MAVYRSLRGAGASAPAPFGPKARRIAEMERVKLRVKRDIIPEHLVALPPADRQIFPDQLTDPERKLR